ncbi:MAG: inositol monophosphatase family protein [Saprospiraceae bacterium]
MNWEKLTRDALPVVEQAAKFIRDEAGKVRPEQIEEKFLNGLVSYVDRGAEQLLVEGLSRLLPEATFLTEEEVIKQEESALQWIVDPLDGTTNFLHQLPHYAISVGLKAEGELVAGLVCHVPANEYYYASKGGGAWCNGRPIRVSQKPALREALIATGFPYHDFEREAAWYKAFHQLMLETRGLRRFGAAALDLAWVACGRYDAFFEYGLSPWDVAGGAVLVREAGGVVHDFSGGDSFMEKSELLAGSAAIMEPLEAIIQSAF